MRISKRLRQRAAVICSAYAFWLRNKRYGWSANDMQDVLVDREARDLVQELGQRCFRVRSYSDLQLARLYDLAEAMLLDGWTP